MHRAAAPLRAGVGCAVCVLALAVSAPGLAAAKGCAEGSPAEPVPSSLWGELQPETILNDATDYTGNQLANSKYPQFTSVDVENGYLFASYWSGFGIWDGRTTPQSPSKITLIDGWAASDCRQGSNVFPSWPGCGEFDNWIWSLDAPEGDDTFVGIGGMSPIGIAIFDTTDKSAPVLRYQDKSKDFEQVYATTIGGRAYLFAASFDYGLYAYDMTAAREGNLTKCLDNSAHTACPGVYKSTLAAAGVQYVHGAKFNGRAFAVGTGGYGGAFVRLFDVTAPAGPLSLGTFPSPDTYGTALWAQGSHLYLALRHATSLAIVDVTDCLGGGCTTLPVPLSTTLAPEYDSSQWKPVIFSSSGASPMLFLGQHDLCHSNETDPPRDIEVDHTEFLFDASNPAAPREITPTGTLLTHNPTASATDDRLVDYWSWYYSDTVRGYAFEAPFAAKFNGEYLYRAARTILDVHRWLSGGPPPLTAKFLWTPDPVLAGTPVGFSDVSTGVETSRQWTFSGASPSVASSTDSVATVTFASPGVATVKLQVGNGAEQSSKQVDITVGDPNCQNPPLVQSFGIVKEFGVCSLSAIEAGATVSMADDVSGQVATYDYDWNGDGTYDETAAVPLTSHVYLVESGLPTTVQPRLRVTDANGCQATGVSDCSASLECAGIQTAPAAPTALEVTSRADTTAALAWVDASSNEFYFRVEKKAEVCAGTSPFTLDQTLPAGTTTALVTGLVPEVPYCFRLQATNCAAPYSAQAVATVSAPIDAGAAHLFFATGFEPGEGWATAAVAP